MTTPSNIQKETPVQSEQTKRIERYPTVWHNRIQSETIVGELRELSCRVDAVEANVAGHEQQIGRLESQATDGHRQGAEAVEMTTEQYRREADWRTAIGTLQGALLGISWRDDVPKELRDKCKELANEYRPSNGPQPSAVGDNAPQVRDGTSGALGEAAPLSAPPSPPTLQKPDARNAAEEIAQLIYKETIRIQTQWNSENLPWIGTAHVVKVILPVLESFHTSSSEGLRRENERLKRGDFTPEEFQNLCHNHDCAGSAEVFCDGCEGYQKKLFGFSPITALRSKVASLESSRDAAVKAAQETCHPAWDDTAHAIRWLHGEVVRYGAERDSALLRAEKAEGESADVAAQMGEDIMVARGRVRELESELSSLKERLRAADELISAIATGTQGATTFARQLSLQQINQVTRKYLASSPPPAPATEPPAPVGFKIKQATAGNYSGKWFVTDERRVDPWSYYLYPDGSWRHGAVSVNDHAYYDTPEAAQAVIDRISSPPKVSEKEVRRLRAALKDLEVNS